MNDTQNIPLKIYQAFEDLYFEKGKGKIFDDIFTKYFAPLDIDRHMDLYDVLVLICEKHPEQFDEMVKEFRVNSIIIE
ncbi:MAG: hypothetical protein L6290_02725 [Thermodesulfovibrionales bacterium]|nr:hypothetical protein [Thermodesulfovibrionales bacterium]